MRIVLFILIALLLVQVSHAEETASSEVTEAPLPQEEVSPEEVAPDENGLDPIFEEDDDSEDNNAIIDEKPVVTKEIDVMDAQNYLTRYGYIQPDNVMSRGRFAVPQSRRTIFRNAVRKFQRFTGQRATGILDEKTKKWMNMPRCGISDMAIVRDPDGNLLKWHKSRITYSIENFTRDLSINQVRRAIRDAYNFWARVTNLEFVEVPRGQGDIKVRFGKREHGDPWPFDGYGNVLAHATFPDSGALHFDDDENWTLRNRRKLATKRYRDLFVVAIHEGGHTLGLEHSNDMKSIMAPIIIETIDEYGRYIYPKLKPRDIKAIQDLYGRRRTPFRVPRLRRLDVRYYRPAYRTWNAIFGKR